MHVPDGSGDPELLSARTRKLACIVIRQAYGQDNFFRGQYVISGQGGTRGEGQDILRLDIGE